MKIKLLLLFLLTLSNDVFASHWESVVLANSNFKYTIPNASIANWNTLGFNDVSWSSGPCGIGFGDNDDATILPNGTVTVYVRKSFNLIDTSVILNGIFNIDYDDAFVAYLNGVEIARSSGMVGMTPNWNDVSSQSHEAKMYQGGTPEYYIIDQNLFKSLIRNGNNILAIEVHNESAQSGDMSCIPFLNIEIAPNGNFYNPTPAWFMSPYISSNLPIFVINTKNYQPVVNEPKIEADMKIIYNGPGQMNQINDNPNYQGMIGIEYRGSYSQSLPQKPFLFETYNGTFGNDTNVSLLGMPKESDWILQATYNDKTFLRNVMTFDMARLGGEYGTRTQHCEVILNGEYIGIYFLCEKIKVNSDRVIMNKMTANDNAAPNVTGGYIFKHDYNAPGWTSQWISPNCITSLLNYQYDYPKPANITNPQKNYIKNYVDSLETALLSPTFADPNTGFRKYIDEKSFIDYFLLNELALNGDGFKKSMYFHKDRMSKIKAGPVWDFDWALKYSPWFPNNLSGYIHTIDPCSQDVPIIFWFKRMMEDSQFSNSVKCRYNTLRAYVMDTTRMFHYIDSMANYLNQAQARHFTRWPILGINVGTPENGPIPTTYAGEITRFKKFYKDRILWLDNNLPGTCNTPLIIPPLHAVEFSELNYHSDNTRDAGDWVELHNRTANTLNVGRWQLQDSHIGLRYTIPDNTTIPPNGHLVLASDLTKFAQQFPNVNNVLGNLPFDFSNNGEKISLFTNIGTTAIEMIYSDSTGWPCTADGHGRTMELVSTGVNPNLQTSWLDGCMGGSPGTAFINCIENPIVNEINYNSSPNADAGDWVELHSKQNTPFNISGWTVTDQNNTGYTFPNNTSIPAYGYVTLYNQFAKFSSQFPSGNNTYGPMNFNLSSTKDVVKIFDQSGQVFQSVCYLSSAPYPTQPNGGGYSLQLIDSIGNLNKASSWDKSCDKGTPNNKNKFPCWVTSTQDMSTDYITIYPNPTLQTIFIDTRLNFDEPIKIELFNMLGKSMLLKEYHTQGIITLSLQDYSPGIYYLHIKMKDKTYIEKINKQ
ncbi:MAG TPA: CotH kinase family protein [Chitinophagaceae bacterium]|nr:MAG: spore coat protein CotH [Bacteroidetes bacterium OLB11]HMN32410.1 CotH kinase family protein [Chitinophagaceae bacterium]